MVRFWATMSDMNGLRKGLIASPRARGTGIENFSRVSASHRYRWAAQARIGTPRLPIARARSPPRATTCLKIPPAAPSYPRQVTSTARTPTSALSAITAAAPGLTPCGPEARPSSRSPTVPTAARPVSAWISAAIGARVGLALAVHCVTWAPTSTAPGRSGYTWRSSQGDSKGLL